MDEERLLALLKVDDVLSFDAIYEKYWRLLYNAAYKRLPNADNCKDIVQNVFISLWERRGEVEIRNLQSYLLSAVRLQVLKQIEKKSMEGRFFMEKHISVSANTADETLLKHELNIALERHINKLPLKRRSIFKMYFFDHLSTAQIAQELEISRKTVQNQLATATSYVKAHIAHLFLTIVFAILINR